LKTLSLCSWSDNGIRYAASVGIFFVHKDTGWWAAVKQNVGLVAQKFGPQKRKEDKKAEYFEDTVNFWGYVWKSVDVRAFELGPVLQYFLCFTNEIIHG